MQAIQTKYLGPTNTRGARIKAMCSAGTITIQYEDEKSHRVAAETLAAKLNWTTPLLGGQLPDHSHVFVFDHELSKD